MTNIGVLDKFGFGYKVYFNIVSGPSSYSTGGFEVTVPNANKIYGALAMYIGNSDYLAQINDSFPKTGSTVKIMVRQNIEQAVNEGGTGSYTIGGEVADGTDLSSLSFFVLVIYE